VIVGIGHVDLVCRDLERSLEFYAAVLGPLGPQEPALFEGERGEAAYYVLPGGGLGCDRTEAGARGARVRALLAVRIEVASARNARL
jgi:catechol 2,3-dioxygenase-like lactoylglutathione lyase family enzyme